jgi:hypothetical protein
MKARTRAQAGLVTAIVMAACLAGCATAPWHKVPLDATSGLYGDATLTYRLDAGKLGQPLDVVRIESQRVTYEQVASSPLPDESIGTLSVIYPHPSRRAGWALARFALESVAARPAERVAEGWLAFGAKRQDLEAPLAIAGAQPKLHETWELDLAAGESEQIFKTLNDIGFYTSDRPGGVAHLAVQMNGRQQAKPWEQIAALNLLIQRVRTQGRLVAYQRATTADGSPAATISSTAAYGELWARGGLAGPTTSPVANAFSLSPLLPAAAAGPGFPATPQPAIVAGRPAGATR